MLLLWLLLFFVFPFSSFYCSARKSLGSFLCFSGLLGLIILLSSLLWSFSSPLCLPLPRWFALIAFCFYLGLLGACFRSAWCRKKTSLNANFLISFLSRPQSNLSRNNFFFLLQPAPHCLTFLLSCLSWLSLESRKVCACVCFASLSLPFPLFFLISN